MYCLTHTQFYYDDYFGRQGDIVTQKFFPTRELAIAQAEELFKAQVFSILAKELHVVPLFYQAKEEGETISWGAICSEPYYPGDFEITVAPLIVTTEIESTREIFEYAYNFRSRKFENFKNVMKTHDEQTKQWLRFALEEKEELDLDFNREEELNDKISEYKEILKQLPKILELFQREFPDYVK